MRRPLDHMAWLGLWAVLAGTALLLRPPLPIDETRYLSVAWEMWQTGDWLVPRLNGEPYSHKPPLLFWCILAGWKIFGVNDVSARLIAPLFGLASLWLSSRLAALLWPEIPAAARVAPLVLLSLPLWAVWTTLTMFDVPLTFFVLLAMIGLVHAAGGRPLAGRALLTFGLAGGVLTKGPAVLLHVLPVALAAPWWRVDTRRQVLSWYLGLLGVVLAATGLALLWAAPAAVAGGTDYGRAILWGQTAGRMLRSFDHARPWWWYLPLVPLAALPWTFVPRLWRPWGLPARVAADPGLRYCLTWAGTGLLLLSLTSGKQAHYLVPLLPALALMIGHGLVQRGEKHLARRPWPSAVLLASLGPAYVLLAQRYPGRWLVETSGWYLLWGLLLVATITMLLCLRPSTLERAVRHVAGATASLVLLAHLGPLHHLRPAFTLRDAAGCVGALQRRGDEIAVWPSSMAGQWQYLGRLTRPLTLLADQNAAAEWIDASPRRHALLVTATAPAPNPSLAASLPARPLRDGWLSLWSAADVKNSCASDVVGGTRHDGRTSMRESPEP